MWLILFVKDLFVKRCKNSINFKQRIWFDKFEAKWHNLAHRFSYEVFLELILCALISFANRRPYSDDNFSEKDNLEQPNLTASDNFIQMNTILSIVCCTVFAAFFLWAISFSWQFVLAVLCCRKTRGKSIDSGISSCSRNCIPCMRSCPSKCPGATLRLIKCKRCFKKNRSKRRHAKISTKYLDENYSGLSDKSQVASERSNMSDSGSDFDYVIERKNEQLEAQRKA